MLASPFAGLSTAWTSLSYCYNRRLLDVLLLETNTLPVLALAVVLQELAQLALEQGAQLHAFTAVMHPGTTWGHAKPLGSRNGRAHPDLVVGRLLVDHIRAVGRDDEGHDARLDAVVSYNERGQAYLLAFLHELTLYSTSHWPLPKSSHRTSRPSCKMSMSLSAMSWYSASVRSLQNVSAGRGRLSNSLPLKEQSGLDTHRNSIPGASPGSPCGVDDVERVCGRAATENEVEASVGRARVAARDAVENDAAMGRVARARWARKSRRGAVRTDIADESSGENEETSRLPNVVKCRQRRWLWRVSDLCRPVKVALGSMV